MATQENLDKVYMRMAEELSTLSYAKRKKVGCLIVKDTQIISEGYNGTPKGFPNECEYYSYTQESVTLPTVLHAESNALTKLARSTNSSAGATLYVTMAPCIECAKLIIQSGIERVVFRDSYPKNGLGILRQATVQTDSVEDYEKEP